MWWDGRASERYWVEIRRAEGIGTSLSSPNRDVNGDRNGWYDLVGAVAEGDVIYHYNARESRFVGRSVAAEDAWEDRRGGEYGASLRDFTPIVAPVDLATLRSHAGEIYAMRDRLAGSHPPPHFLPFQFTTDRSQLRMMSNYFAKLPRELVVLLFGADGLASASVPALPPLPGEAADGAGPGAPDPGEGPGTFLEPFKPKADSDYSVELVGGRHRRTRAHEMLVNSCAKWLESKGLVTGRNAAVDLGVQDPKVIIEAKTVGKGWPTSIREAIGQLYEYRYFKVCEPGAGLVFLAAEPVPDAWVRYLEGDRQIGAMWRDKAGFKMSPLARKYLGL